MLRSILVGLDGSPFSDTAVELSIVWAKQFDAQLTGLGIVDEPTIREPTGFMIGSGHYKSVADELHLADAKQRVHQFLEEFASRCEQAGVEAKCLEEVGLPEERILLEAQRFDLIVLGKQSYFHFETQEGPGQTLHNILQNTPRPVVTVPENPSQGDSVLIAYDGSLQSARVLQAFLFSGLWRDKQVHVAAIHQDPSEADKCVDRALEFLKSHDIKAQRHSLESKQAPSTYILNLTKEVNAGLLVMGAYGEPTLKEFFFGSTTRQAMKETTVPLFLYH